MDERENPSAKGNLIHSIPHARCAAGLTLHGVHLQAVVGCGLQKILWTNKD
jgi:hypothetical protein